MPHAAATRSVATASHDIPRDASSDATETLPFRRDGLVDLCLVRLKTGETGEPCPVCRQTQRHINRFSSLLYDQNVTKKHLLPPVSLELPFAIVQRANLRQHVRCYATSDQKEAKKRKNREKQFVTCRVLSHLEMQ
jgi:hypothetical protein